MSKFSDCKLEHVFDIVVEFGADRTTFGPLPGGDQQGYTPPIGGTITGPRLNGIVVPRSGADYAIVRSDGVLELEAHYMLQADDGTLIYIVNRGYLVRAPEGTGEKNDQGMVQPAYFRCTPIFRVPAVRMTGWPVRCLSAAGNVVRTPITRSFAITRFGNRRSLANL